MSKSSLLSSSAVLLGFSLVQSQVTFGGWTGSMNGLGVGRSSANVTSSTGNNKAVANPAPIQNPGSGVVSFPVGNPPYQVSSGLPTGAASTSSSLIAGSAGYKWSASTSATAGDKADNVVIENLGLLDPEQFGVTPQMFALLSINTSLGTDGNGNPILNISGIASGGTAYLIRGFNSPNGFPTDEQLNDLNPEDFPLFFFDRGEGSGSNTDEPFRFSIPFPQDTDPSTFYVTVDALAVSTAAPDAGSLTLAFAATAGGMALVRRRLDRPANKA